VSSAEFPGFHLPGAPVFSRASGTSMDGVLDLAMVFGSRLWGHDLSFLEQALDAAPGCGDLYTHELREQACQALCARVASETGEAADAYRALVLHTGSEAVETAIKTALRATGRDRIIAFEGGYHGTFGLALAVTHGAAFREPWEAQLPDTVSWSPWGEVPELDERIACVVLEPWQGRAGVLPPPPGFLAAVRAECDRVGALLVLDAVLCGAGRTGPTIAEGLTDARPDLLCLGKAVGAGVPASAVVARTDIASAAWDRGPVEPAHTSTHVGEPIACLGILHALMRLERDAGSLEEGALAWETALRQVATERGWNLRGTGMLWALDTAVPGTGVELAQELLEGGILTVPSGLDSSAISLYPSAGTEPTACCARLRAAVCR